MVDFLTLQARQTAFGISYLLFSTKFPSENNNNITNNNNNNNHHHHYYYNDNNFALL